MDLIVTPEQYGRMRESCQRSKAEVGMLYRLRRLDKESFAMEALTMVKQESNEGGLDVALDPLAVEEWKKEFLTLDEERVGLPDVDYGWWHHHVNAGVSPSPTDKEFMEDHSTNGWLCTLIFNRKDSVHLQWTTFAGSREKRFATLVEAKTGVIRVDYSEEGIVEQVERDLERFVTYVDRTPVVSASAEAAYFGHFMDRGGYDGYKGYGGVSDANKNGLAWLNADIAAKEFKQKEELAMKREEAREKALAKQRAKQARKAEGKKQWGRGRRGLQ